MGYSVVKHSVMVDQGQQNTNQTAAFGGRSPVTVTLSNGQTFSWGPNESHTLEDNFAAEAVAADNRLKVVSRS